MTLGPRAGDAVFDLYAPDIGQWKVHSGIVAAVLLADDRRLSHAQLDRPARGRPLSGSGGFKFERAQEHCAGQGMWSNR
jgi:hypothetical protein